MTSKPITHVDPAQLAVGDAYPLTIVGDGILETPDFVLEGELAATPGSAYSYALSLDANVDYRLLLAGLATSSGIHAILANAATGDVYWGNDAALAALGADPDRAADVLAFDAPTELKLVISGPAIPPDGAETLLFRLETRADADRQYTDNPIHRYTNVDNGAFLYTASVEEMAYIAASVPNMHLDGVAFIGDDEARPGYVPVHRFASLDGGGWYFSIDPAEINDMLTRSETFRDEGIGFYVPLDYVEGVTQPVFRADNFDGGGMLLTTNPIEMFYYLLHGGWLNHGVAFFSDTTLDPVLPPVDLIGASGTGGE